MNTPITQTGIRGFLLWLKREQPHLYNKVAPQLPSVAPKAFSNYMTDRKKMHAIYRTKFAHRVGVGGFAGYFDNTGSTMAPIYVSAPSIPVTVNYTSDLSQLPSYDISQPNFSSVSVESPVASAANTGSSSSGTANAIMQVVGAASSIYLTSQQAATQQSVLQSQLARAQAGLPPLNTSLNQLGVPTISTGGILGTNGGVVLGVIAAIGLALALGSKKSV